LFYVPPRDKVFASTVTFKSNTFKLDYILMGVTHSYNLLNVFRFEGHNHYDVALVTAILLGIPLLIFISGNLGSLGPLKGFSTIDYLLSLNSLDMYFL